MKPFYITTPIYYVNDVPHLGHAYTTVAADAFARFFRARGRDCWFLTGTDEHGQKIEDAAKARGRTPIEHADAVVQRFRDTWRRLDIACDDFIRTTEERHETVVQDMWRRLKEAGDIYLGDYEGLYCKSCEAFYTEGQLDKGNCPDHGTPVDAVKETSYFFRMSKYQDRLLEHFDKHPDFVRPVGRKNEIVSFIKAGLRDLSVSRTTFSWGVPVPDDKDHVIYVWIDALTNYISALGGPAGKDYDKLWPATCHLIGKDILRFHAVYWPCMLMSAGLELPETIMAHGWWTLRGAKISKSQPATRVDPNVIADDLGADSLRYFLLREVPLGLDGDFSYEALFARHNADLANDLGNLVNRTTAMAVKYFEGKIPAANPSLDTQEPQSELLKLANETRDKAAAHFEQYAPSKALEEIWNFVRGANRYIDAAAPWKLAKDPKQRALLEHTVHTFLEAVLWSAHFVWPVMPKKAEEIFSRLGADKSPRWPKNWNAELVAGQMATKGDPLFPRLDDKQKEALLDKWLPTSQD